VSGYREILRVDDGADNGFEMTIMPSGDLGGASKLGGSWSSGATTGLALRDNRWHHAALVLDGVSATVYLDGAAAATFTGASGVTVSNVRMMIGKYTTTGRNFAGALDEIRVWTTARTTEQIRQGLARPVRSDEPGLAVLYHFDEPVGATAYDATAQKAHAFLSGIYAHIPSGAMAPLRPTIVSAVPGNAQVTLAWNRNTESDLMRYRMAALPRIRRPRSTLPRCTIHYSPFNRSPTELPTTSGSLRSTARSMKVRQAPMQAPSRCCLRREHQARPVRRTAPWS
jgi:hypothetical protein